METDFGERDLVPVDWELIFLFYLLLKKCTSDHCQSQDALRKKVKML